MKSMKRKIQLGENEEERSSASWLTTFNDMMTLLMVFFVLIFSMSTLDLKRTNGLIENLQSALGVLMTGKKVSVAVSDDRLDDRATEQMDKTDEKQSENMMNLPDNIMAAQGANSRRPSPELIDLMKTLKRDPSIQARFSSEGLNLSLENNILFEPGKARINPAGDAVLGRIAEQLRKLSNYVRIEGHTDDVPIATELYPSNWELSVARAVNVLKYLINAGPISAARMSAVGYGDSKPLYPNDSRQRRAKNRRVEIILISEGK